MHRVIKRCFGYTAYTWEHSLTNGYPKSSTSATKDVVRPIESLRGKIAKISFTKKHAMALTDDATLFSWGQKKYGKLGLSGVPPAVVDSPAEVTFFTREKIKVKDFR